MFTGYSTLSVIRVSTLAVVVRELFSLVMSVIWVRIRGQRLQGLFTTWLRFLSTAAFSPQ